jgi:hypothetical protein
MPSGARTGWSISTIQLPRSSTTFRRHCQPSLNIRDNERLAELADSLAPRSSPARSNIA